MKASVTVIWLCVALCLCGCNQGTNSRSHLPDYTLEQPSPELDAKLRAFFSQKARQARELEQIDKTGSTGSASAAFRRNGLPPDVWAFFSAGERGDWSKVMKLYFGMAARSHQFESPRDPDERLLTTAWTPINEAYRAYEQLGAADPKFVLAYGSAIIDSIPPGSVYFAGTDAGRFAVDFLTRSEGESKRIFIIAQNSLLDELYREYLTSMFADMISIPTTEDSRQAFGSYLADAQRRLEQNQLKPDENAEIVEGRIRVWGAQPIKTINARIMKVMFENNPDREFFLDDGGWTALDDLYSHLSPHGFIFRINREGLPELSVDTVRKDREFWTREVARTIGGWLDETTSVEEICAFGEKVFLRRDLSGFQGDPQFVRTAHSWRRLPEFLGASAVFSKARSNIASLYAWRAQNARSSEERESMLKEADFAFRQAISLCPYQYNAIRGYYEFLWEQQRYAEAVRIIETTVRFFPSNSTYVDFLRTSANQAGRNTN
jgi:tetratricopeptide (TPR) repeat protein